MTTSTETLTWHEMPDSNPPDAEITVLVELLPPDGDAKPDGTEVWPAWWSGERWIDAGSGWHIETHRVVAWADVPRGTRGA